MLSVFQVIADIMH